KRWFILWSSQCSGDPGVLEYYRHAQSKKPLWIISLDLCEQVQANVTFHKKGLLCGFMFNIKTNKHTFYLVAETKDDMYKWVQSICQICRFQQEVESTAELTRSWQQHLQEQRYSTLPHPSQPTLLTGYPLSGKKHSPPGPPEHHSSTSIHTSTWARA
ncbi:GRB2-associated-binding protein 2, partial [Sciurus carolinensis]|nr:GRB2-associated-binding protein 2 [Sciurus carolinensis]